METQAGTTLVTGSNPVSQMEKKVLEQKEAIYLFLDQILNIGGLDLSEGKTIRSYVTKAVRKEVRLKLFAGFRDGSIKLNKTKTDSELKKYCSSVVGNWLDKDERYN